MYILDIESEQKKEKVLISRENIILKKDIRIKTVWQEDEEQH